MASKVPVGVIGLGRLGSQHALNIATKILNAKLTAVADPSAPPKEFVKDSGGLFIDMCIHDIDIARWYMGAEIESVSAHGGVIMYDFLKEYKDIDQAMITVKFDNGSLGSIEGSRNSTYGYDIRTEIVGTKGAIMIGQWQHKPFLLLNSSGLIKETVPAFPERFKDAYLLELQSFVDNIVSGKSPVVNANDGYVAMKVAIKAKESFEKGTIIPIILENDL